MTSFVPNGNKHSNPFTGLPLALKQASRRLLLFLAFCLPGFNIQAQVSTLPIGGWRSYLSYHQVIDVAQSDHYVYLATPWALLVVDKSDGSQFKMDKINALSETGIQQVAYNREGKTLMVAYINNKIDLLQGPAKL